MPVVEARHDQQQHPDDRDQHAGGEPLAAFLRASRLDGTSVRLVGGCRSTARSTRRGSDLGGSCQTALGRGPTCRTLRVLTNGRIVVTSAGAATNSTISACSTVVRVSGVWATLCMAKPPACSAPNSSPASTMPSGLDRPSRATVIASKPIEPTMPADSGTGTPDAVGPSAACTPASPASAPASDHGDDGGPADAHPAVAAACGLAPTARIAKPMVDRSSIHQTATAASSATSEAEVQLAALQPREGGVPVDDRGDRVGPPGPLEGRRGEEVGQQPGGDVVHHDRHDHLVGAGPGLEPADDAAPDAATDDSPPSTATQQVDAPAAGAR